MKHGSTWWTRPLPQISTYCASVTTLDWTDPNNNWQTLCCTCTPTLRRLDKEKNTKRISSRHSATEVCQMNSLPTSPVTQHTDQQTSQTNQKHESKIWHWDIASGQDLCENNLPARTWAHQLLQLSTSQTAQHKNIKHTRANNLNFTNYAWSVVVGKQGRQDRQKRGETKGNLSNTLPKRNPTNCAAITTRWWACTHDERQTLREKHLHLKISTWRPRGMNQKWPRHAKKVLNELTMDTLKQSPSKQRNRQEPKRLFREIPSDEKLDHNNLESDWFNPGHLWTNKKTSQRHNISCNRPPQSRQNESRSTGSHCEEHVFLEISLHKHEEQLADTLLHLPEDCTERRNLVKSLCEEDELITDVSSWPTNKPNEPEARMNIIIWRNFCWDWRTWVLWTASTESPTHSSNIHEQTFFNFYECRTNNTQFKYSLKNHVNIANYSNTHGKPCQYYESQHDQLKIWSTRNPTNCAAITTRLWAGTDEHNVLQSLPRSTCTCQFQLGHREDVSEGWTRNDLVTWLSEKGCWMNTSWTSGLKTIQHEENEEREKHEQTVIMKSNSGWKTFWRTTAMRERKPPGNKNWLRSHTISPTKTATNNAQTPSSNTLWPTLQNDSNFTAPSMTKKHAFPDVVLAWNETRFHMVDTPTSH